MLQRTGDRSDGAVSAHLYSGPVEHTHCSAQRYVPEHPGRCAEGTRPQQGLDHIQSRTQFRPHRQGKGHLTKSLKIQLSPEEDGRRPSHCNIYSYQTFGVETTGLG